MLLQTLSSQKEASRNHHDVPWPDGVAFREAIQSPQTALDDPELGAAEVVLDRLGLPLAYSGRCAVVFRLRTPEGDWALRCFTQPLEADERRERYHAIARKLAEFPRHFVPFRYLERGIRVAGRWYPAVAMRWAEGETLGRWVEARHDDPFALDALCAALTALLRDLEAAGIAHGDWQHDNLLVSDEGRTITLVDYDGMFVPALAGAAALETGHGSFQHPARTPQHFGVGLDRFPHLVMQTALLAISRDPSLWRRFNDGESLLFKPADLANPDGSPVFGALRALADEDAALAAWLGHLDRACRAGANGVLRAGDPAALPAETQPARQARSRWLRTEQAARAERWSLVCGRLYFGALALMLGYGMATLPPLPQALITLLRERSVFLTVFSLTLLASFPLSVLAWITGSALLNTPYTRWWPRKRIYDALLREIRRCEKRLEERRDKLAALRRLPGAALDIARLEREAAENQAELRHLWREAALLPDASRRTYFRKLLGRPAAP